MNSFLTESEFQAAIWINQLFELIRLDYLQHIPIF